MKVRIGPTVSIRNEAFGGVAYVHSRNDFFFLDSHSYGLVEKAGRTWTVVEERWRSAYRRLCGFGICESIEPRTAESSFRGTAFIGSFEDIPKVSNPLVLNCFTTSHCPLACRYCHADDLMKPFRVSEGDEDIDRVISTARNVNSMVAVLTGGDPITRIGRTTRIIEGIGHSKPLVMDTSGVPNSRAEFEKLVPVMSAYRVHARVSLDEFEDTNSRIRPINRKYVSDGRSSYSHARESIELLLAAGIPVTVQTVLSRYNDRPQTLLDFARVISGWGVRHWVVHVTVNAGKAGMVSRTQLSSYQASLHSLVPEAGGLKTLRHLLRLLDESNIPLDVRVTNANPIKHAVFLVSSDGNLYTEGMAKLGKKLTFRSADIHPGVDIWKDVDAKAHTARYANWIEGLFPNRTLAELTTLL